MGGKASRDKGKRGEYGLRDYLRDKGFDAHRVPSSGAAQGFKGDVASTKDGERYLFEMKCRAAAFGSIYTLWNYSKLACLDIWYPEQDIEVSISENVLHVIEKNKSFSELDSKALSVECRRGLRKILSVQQFVKGCDILALKDDRRPTLFIRYS